MIETKRLQIIPLPQEQLFLYIKADPLLEKQLNIQPFARSFSRDLLEVFEHIILQRVADVKNKYEFFTLWIILLREKRIAVGDLFFKGNPDELGAIEIGYGIFEGFRSRGYMTEALAGMVDWAKHQPGVKTMIAETVITNQASLKILENNHFRLYRQKQAAVWFRLRLKNK